MPQFQKIENKTEWQELLNKTLFKTFFHSFDWENFLENNFKWLKFERYLYKDELLLSLANCKIFKKEKLISHPFCEYGGPLPLKNEIDGIEFRKYLFLNFKKPIKISFHPQLPKYFKSLQLKEPDSSRDTYLIEDFNKKTAEQTFSSFRKTLRHSIKKAQNQNLQIKKCENEKELRALYKIYLQTTKRNRTIPYPFFFFQFFLNHQVNTTNNGAEIVLVKFKNKIIAGSLFLFYEKNIHYFLNASEEKYKKLNANYLILWEQIRNYVGKNYQVFDLGGTRRESSLEIFKKGWGGKRYPIFELKNFSESKLKESKLRNVFGILPSFLLKRFSSYLLQYKL